MERKTNEIVDRGHKMNTIPYRGKIDEVLVRELAKPLISPPFLLQEVDWLRLQKPPQPSWWWSSIFGLTIGVLLKIGEKLYAVIEKGGLQSSSYITVIGVFDVIFLVFLLTVLGTSAISAWKGVKDSKSTRTIIDEHFNHFKLDR